MKCDFHKNDEQGRRRWNLVEGNTNAGRVACIHCGQIVPRPSKPLEAWPDNKQLHPMGRCPGSPEALAAKGETKGCTGCIESAIARAEKAFTSLVDQLAAAYSKGNEDIKAAIMEETAGIKPPNFERLKIMALKQALQEGKEHDRTSQPAAQQ